MRRGFSLATALLRFANDEFDSGLITLLEVDGSTVGMIRHGDDEAATAADVLATLQFETE